MTTNPLTESKNAPLTCAPYHKPGRQRKVVLYFPDPYPKGRIYWGPPIPLLAVASLPHQEGYDVRIISRALYDSPEDVLVQECRDAVCLGISSMTGYQITTGMQATRMIKQRYPEMKIVWGGWHPSLAPEAVISVPEIDVVVRGQGECAFMDILRWISGETRIEDIPGVTYKVDAHVFHNPDRPLEDVAHLPRLPYELIDVERCLRPTEYGKRTMAYVSSYGCPHRCAFCPEQKVFHRRWTAFPATRLLDDLELLISRYRIDSIAYTESNFFVSKQRVRDFCEGLSQRAIKVNWGNCNGRANHLLQFEDDLWELMARTGLKMILIGAESAREESLHLIKKDVPASAPYDLAKQCNKHGIKILFSFFTGLPWLRDDDVDYRYMRKKNAEDLSATLDFIRAIQNLGGNHRYMLELYTPYPGTPLYDLSIRAGYRPPNTLEGWGNYQLEFSHTPWTTARDSLRIRMLSNYIFFFLDANSPSLILPHFSSRLVRLLLSLLFRVAGFFCSVRWRLRFLGCPVDFHIYNYFRERLSI